MNKFLKGLIVAGLVVFVYTTYALKVTVLISPILIILALFHLINIDVLVLLKDITIVFISEVAVLAVLFSLGYFTTKDEL